MDCTQLSREELTTVDFSTKDSFLIVANTRRANWVIDRLRIKGRSQHFSSLGFNTRIVTGHYDVAVIDGGDENLNPMQLFEDLFPYLKRNVKEFYILTE